MDESHTERLTDDVEDALRRARTFLDKAGAALVDLDPSEDPWRHAGALSAVAAGKVAYANIRLEQVLQEHSARRREF
jgi:hypothetical protein